MHNGFTGSNWAKPSVSYHWKKGNFILCVKMNTLFELWKPPDKDGGGRN
jgi:hypothetical protein